MEENKEQLTDQPEQNLHGESPLPKSKRKQVIVIGVSIVFLIAVGLGTFFLKAKTINQPPFKTQQECENQTGKKCSLTMCQVMQDSPPPTDWNCKPGFYPIDKLSSSTSQPSPTVDPIANWKTYINKEFEYSLKYPTNWIVENVAYKSTSSTDTAPSFEGITLRPVNLNPAPANENYHIISVEVIKVSGTQKLEEMVKNWYSFSTPPGKLSEAVKAGEDIMVGGISGKKIINPPIDNAGIPITWILVQHKDNLFKFTVNLDNSYPKIDKELIFNQILSTFKFTDQETSTNTNNLVTITYSGELCPSAVVCSSTYTITQNGELLNNGKKIKSISNNYLTELKALIEQANFAQIKTKPFTGTCPTAYDGQEVTYTFYTKSKKEDVASCKVAIDTNLPLFKKIATILQ